MGAIWTMSWDTSPGMWPVHLERDSRSTGLMTWAVDHSILDRELPMGLLMRSLSHRTVLLQVVARRSRMS